MIFALLWIFGFLAFIFHKNVKKFLSLEITQIDKTSPPWMDLVWILKKPHVRAIVLLILAYGFTVQGSEVIWKYKIRQHYSDPMAYASFITQSTFYTGIFSCIFYLFFTNRLIRMLGWRIAALLTPLGFFLSSLTFSLTFFWSNFDLMIVAMIQLVLCEVGKFALFDPTKEMGYLVLKQDEKVQAKAVADVIAARLGRTFGAFSLQGLMFLSNSFQYIIPNILILIFLSLLGWFWAIQNMSLNIKNSEKF